MTVLMIFVFALFTLGAMGAMVYPFLLSRGQQARYDLLSDEMRQIEELVSLKSLYINHLRELEIDFELEKITQDDYSKVKRQTERAAVQTMRKLDTFYGGKQWQTQIDLLVAQHAKENPTLERKTQAQPTKRATAKATAVETICHSCQTVQADPNAKFCSQCGATLNHQAPSISLSSPSLT